MRRCVEHVSRKFLAGDRTSRVGDTVTKLSLSVRPLPDGVEAKIGGLGSTSDSIRFTSTTHVLSAEPTAWLPVATLTAMSAAAPVEIAGRVDSIALDGARRAQRLLAGWHRDMRPVAVSAGEVYAPSVGTGRGTGVFFSGGVDSFYSAVASGEEISHAIFVTGFDVDPGDAELAEAARAGARDAATEMGLTFVEVTTNVRTVTDPLGDWGVKFHGAALATVALLLSDTVHRVVVPASYHTTELFAWGSHPELDPLWSSTTVQLRHHGEDATRPEKVQFIASNASAMRHLRVCWENRHGRYNCGECEKCIRTMINLRAAGALGRCQTLPDSIDIRVLDGYRSGHGSALFAQQNLEALRNNGVDDVELTRALRRIVRRAPLWDAARKARRLIRR
jgi:hypothetical protein